MLFNAPEYHFKRNKIFTALRYYEVRVFFGWLDVRLVHRLYRIDILAEDRIDASSALLHVARKAAQDAYVGIGIHKNADIEHIAQRGVGKYEYSLDHDNTCGRHPHGRLRAVVDGIVVLRAVDSLPVAQTRKVAHEKICLERLGTVVILPGALLKGQPVLRT